MTYFDQPSGTGATRVPIPPGVLAGPADADHYRVDVGRYRERWYTDPLPTDDVAEALEGTGEPEPGRDAWPAVSTVKKAAGQDWSYVALSRVNRALTDNPRVFDGLGHDDRAARLRRINDAGLDAASARGTNVHTYFELGLRGKAVAPGVPGEPGSEYLTAVSAFLDTYTPRLVAAEVVCLHRTLNGYGYGGTCDTIAHFDSLPGGLPPGAYVVDWKSRGVDSKHGCYPEEAGQVSGYRGSEYVIVDGEHGPERRSTASLGIVGSIVVSVKPDGFRIYPVDHEAGWRHWTSMHAWWVARRGEREAVGRALAPRKAPTLAEQIARVGSREEGAALWRRNAWRWTPDDTEAVADVLAAIK